MAQRVCNASSNCALAFLYERIKPVPTNLEALWRLFFWKNYPMPFTSAVASNHASTFPISGLSVQTVLQDAYWKMSSKAIGQYLRKLICPKSKENNGTHHSMELSMPELQFTSAQARHGARRNSHSTSAKPWPATGIVWQARRACISSSISVEAFSNALLLLSLL